MIAADLVVVHALLDRDDERRGHAEPVEALERLLADAPQIGAAQIHQRVALERVELEVQLEVRHVARQPHRELLVLRDPDAVRVDHQVPDRPRLCAIEHLEELRMDRRLAAGNLHDVGMALVAHDGVEHPLDVIERPVRLAVGAARRVADRAAQVAGVADLDEREARMLLVIGAEPAVVRTAPLHRRVVVRRHLRRLDEHFAAAPVVVDVIGDEHALVSVLRAPLEHEHAVVLKHDLGVHATEARRADRHRDVVEEIRADAHHDPQDLFE